MQNLQRRRVVVTGMGMVTAIGSTVGEFWQSCLQGHSVVADVPQHWHDYVTLTSKLLSPLGELNLATYGVTSVEAAKIDKVTQLALVATYQALEQSGLGLELKNVRSNSYALQAADSQRTGVYYGTGAGGVNTLLAGNAFQAMAQPKKRLERMLKESSEQFDETQRRELEAMRNGMRIQHRANPFIVSMIMPNACAGNISLKFSLTGPSNTLCSACASGTVAIGHGVRAIRHGVVDIAIAGGAEYLKDEFGAIFRGFDMVGALVDDKGEPREACRPFDKNHTGFLFSEGGSATLVLEELEHAKARGAIILGEIIGFAENCDAVNIMAMEKEGVQIKRMLRSALQDAGISAEEVDYINAHGTGTVVNDETEAGVIGELFGRRPLVNSTKSLLGHTIGASGAIEAIVALLSIQNNTTHICNNLKEPIVDLNFVTQVKREEINTAISQSFAFGGQNAALVFKRYYP